MNQLRLGGRPLWPVALLFVLLAAAVAFVLVLRSGDSGSDHGRQLALYGARARATAEKAGETEAGARKGPEEGEVPGRGREAGKKGEAEREREAAERESEAADASKDGDARKAAPEVKGGKGGEGSRHGDRTPWGEQVGNRAYPRSFVDDRIAKRVQRSLRPHPREVLGAQLPFPGRLPQRGRGGAGQLELDRPRDAERLR